VQNDVSKPKILLHCCCAPCASYVLEYLLPEYTVSVLFYNPNIEPQDEYVKRKQEMSELLFKASLTSTVGLIECEYDNAAFINAALSLRNEPEGGARCRLCFELRLSETARMAKAGEYDIFATTLSVSPHKDAVLLNEIGSAIANEYGLEYLQADFKKKNGYIRSVELSKQYDLYRQDYCGCMSQGLGILGTRDSTLDPQK